MNRKFVLLLPLCFAIVLAGCVQPTPVVDSHLGQSLTMIKAQQIINPEAARNTDPVAGIDGKAGKNGYDEYQKSYRVQEPQTNVFTIGVSGAR